MLPWASEVFGEQRIWRLQQENAPILSSNYTRQRMGKKGIQVLPWPARSPDLHIIEKVWGMLAKCVYARGKQFKNLTQLREAMEEAYATFS